MVAVFPRVSSFLSDAIDSIRLRLIASWITELFDKCRDQGTLYLTDLYDLLPNYQSAQLVDDLEIHWFEELKRNPEKPSLLRATLHAMRWKPVLIGSMLIPTVRNNLRFLSWPWHERCLSRFLREETCVSRTPITHPLPDGVFSTVSNDVHPVGVFSRQLHDFLSTSVQHYPSSGEWGSGRMDKSAVFC